MPLTTTFLSGHAALELNGTVVGILASVDGGRITGDVIEETGPRGYVTKHLGGVSYSDIVLTAGFGMDPSFYRWVSDSFGTKTQSKPVSGAIIRCDANFKPIARRAFDEALISSVTFPKLDATSKDPAFLTVSISPERIHDESPGADPLQTTRARMAVARNFRLDIEKLDCQRVSHVDALTVTLPRTAESIGIIREPIPARQPPRFSNLNVTVASIAAQDWRDAFQQFVVDGQNATEDEKKGTLTLLTTDLAKPIATVAFEGLGIFSLDEEWPAAGAETLPRLTASFYCERFSLAVAAPSPTAAAVKVPAA